MNLDGAVALITGAASGIGQRAAAAFAARGAGVVLADIADASGAAAAASGRAITLDVRDADAWASAVDDVLAVEGRLDVVALNAGVSTGEADPVALTDEQYRRAVGVNLDGVVLGVRACLPALSDGGALVATASLGGLVPMPMDPVYSATKHAVVAYMRSIAEPLAARGVTANAVCPGFADTPLVAGELRAGMDELGVPLLDPQVVAETIVRVAEGGGTGEAWFIQPGREPAPYAFRGVPGPR